MSPFLLTLPPMPETPYIWNWMLSSYQKRHTKLNSYCRENGHLFELWIMSALCYRRRHGGSESSLMWPHHLAIGTYSMRAPKKEWGGGKQLYHSVSQSLQLFSDPSNEVIFP